MRGAKLTLVILACIACVAALCAMLLFGKGITFEVQRLLSRRLQDEEVMLIDLLKKNPRELFRSYAAYLDEQPEHQKTCHGVLHRIGHEALEKLGWNAAMDIAKPLCGGGYIHGVIEAKFGLLSSLSPSLVLDEIVGACGDASNEVCYHGIGHGLMVMYRNDIDRSLDGCASASLPGRIDCYDGVFMHVFDAEETGIAKDIPERVQGSSFCETVSKERQISCLFYAPRIFARTSTMARDAVQMCEGLSGEEKRKNCAVGAGHMFVKYFLPDVTKGKEACALFSEKLHEDCMYGGTLYTRLQESTHSVSL